MDLNHQDGQNDAEELSSQPRDHGLRVGDCNDPDWVGGREYLSSQPPHDDAEPLSPNLEERALTTATEAEEGADDLDLDLDLDLEAFERQMSSMGIIPYNRSSSPRNEEDHPPPDSSPLAGPMSEEADEADEASASPSSVAAAGATTIHKAYEKLHHPVGDDLVDKMRIALGDIPPVTRTQPLYEAS